MIKDQILKIAKVKSEADFYRKFPTEAAFMKMHGKAFKKAAMGASMVNKQLHQLTDFGNPPKAQFGVEEDGYGFGSVYGQPEYNPNTTAVGGVDPKAKTAQEATQSKGMPKIKGEEGSDATAYLQAGMDVIEGVSMIKDQNLAVKTAKQNSLLTGVQADAVSSQRQQPLKRYYTRPEDTIIQPEQLSPSYGVGTNILSAQDGAMVGGNPTEIQNTYAPNTLYDDLGYEPLNDSDQIKAFYHGGKLTKAQNGFENFMVNQGGNEALGNLSNKFINKGRGPSAGSKIGGGVGQAAGTYFGGPVGGAIGKFAGETLGSLVDQSGRNIEKYDDISNRNVAGMMGNYIPQQFSNVMEDGGWVSNDWQPQVIAKFGEYDVKDLLKPPADADMLRAGGHLKSYTPPSERAMQTYAMGGELQVYRGEAEPISNNPYLPDGGETVMFRGPSHENGGMPISYGQSPVEVEGGEPAVKLRDGGSGEDNMVVFGNLKINKEGANMLGNPKLKNQKFKNYVNDLSKIEAKQNKIIDNSTNMLDNLDVNSSFDKLKMSALQANLMGSNMKLKDIAGKKQDAADLQSAINDTAEEYGLIADDLAQGKMKKAKLGASIPMAQDGKLLSDKDYSYINKLYKNADANQKNASAVKKFQQEFTRLVPSVAQKVVSKYPVTAYGKKQGLLATNPLSNVDSEFGKRTKEFMVELNKERNSGMPIDTSVMDTLNTKTNLTGNNFSKFNEQLQQRLKQDVPDLKKRGKNFDLMGIVNQALPYLRPSDQEELDPRQLSGEFYALSNNQLEPVQAQTYQPQLQTPYDISLQDQLNEITAQTREAQRLAGNNPEALAAIYAQATMAKNQVLGEQMRLNQAQKADVYGSNINTLNQAQLQNLQIYDTQQQRQEAAKSATKATTQEALNSVASKYAQNKLENRQLGVMENMYNYRFDKSGRAINMNPLVDFDEMIASATPDELSKYKALLEAKTSKEKTSNKAARNGSIVKAIKNL
jgi:hypothetical protein